MDCSTWLIVIVVAAVVIFAVQQVLVSDRKRTSLSIVIYTRA